MSADQREIMLEMGQVCLSFRTGSASFAQGRHEVLDRVSLKLIRGETLGVIGRNGCGKTTILRVMAGILAADSGTVWRRPGTTSALLTIGLGFKPQLTGRDNALLAAMLQGASRQEAGACLEEIKAFSELGDSFEEPVKTYSTGMRARLGFTTALITHVDVLLIDEVLSVGDSRFRTKAQQAMKDRISGDQTVVFVSHMDAQIRALCDRVIWINEGKIMAEGETGPVLHQYRKYMNA